jgi:hypothetical protein
MSTMGSKTGILEATATSGTKGRTSSMMGSTGGTKMGVLANREFS